MRELLEVCNVKPMRFHGTDVVRCEIVSDAHRNLLIRVYHPPYTLDNLPDLEEALNRLQGREPIIMGDLNTDTGRLQNPCNQQLAIFLESFELVNLLGHFRQRLRF